LAILGGSFRLLAKALLPLAVLFILPGCGGSKPQSTAATVTVRGPGFTFEAPQGWRARGADRSVVARQGGNLVSVTVFALRKPYDPSRFEQVAKTLDAVAARLAAAAGAPSPVAETATVAGRKIRAYRYGGKRIGFVLDGRSEYQLFCAQAGDGCDLLFSSFTLTG
jgi:hypothetical protein